MYICIYIYISIVVFLHYSNLLYYVIEKITYTCFKFIIIMASNHDIPSICVYVSQLIVCLKSIPIKSIHVGIKSILLITKASYIVPAVN